MEQDRGWAKREAAGIGERLAHFRRAAGLTAQELAERCAALGLESLSRVVITKLENGHREAVSTAELRVLARALRVPAVILLFPIGRAETIEVLPGQDAEPWAALEWFIGNSTDPAGPSEEPQMGMGSPVVLWNEHLLHDGLIPVLRREAASRKESSLIGRQIGSEVKALLRVRAEMQHQGMTPPSLHPETAEILGQRT